MRIINKDIQTRLSNSWVGEAHFNLFSIPQRVQPQLSNITYETRVSHQTTYPTFSIFQLASDTDTGPFSIFILALCLYVIWQ